MCIQYSFSRGSGYLDKKGIDYKIMHIPPEGSRTTPTDTPSDVHDAINDYAMKNIGVKVRNGLFTTSNYSTASSYGEVIVIFPLKNSTVYTNPNIVDYTQETDFDRIIADYSNEFILNELYKHDRDGTLDPEFYLEDSDDVDEELYIDVRMEDGDIKERVLELIAGEYVDNIIPVGEIFDTEMMVFGDVLLLTLEKAESLGFHVDG